MNKILTFTSITLFSCSITVSATLEHTHGERSHSHELPEEGILHKHGNGIEGKEKTMEDSTEYDHYSCSSHLYQFYSVGNESGHESKGKSNYSINMAKTTTCQAHVNVATLPPQFAPAGAPSLRQRQNRNYQICLIGFDHGLSSQRMPCKIFIEKTT